MKINRINKIQEMLQETNSASIDHLCDVFNVSKNTIRRDIAELQTRGIIKKVYGGITMNQSANSPEPFASREIKNSAQKKKIAHLAAKSVKDGDVIYIDSGTTTMHMIPFLAERSTLTILTASMHVINAASNYSQINTIATGGSLYIPSKAFVGPSVIQCLGHYNISKIFLASTGVSIENGATNASPLECEIKRFLMKKPADKYLLVDTSKIGRASLMTYCQLKELNYIVMDAQPPKEYLTYFKENNVQLITEEADLILDKTPLY
jgi:DeoR family transcriptional regulator, myo-inositol catabolism operon repressor